MPPTLCPLPHAPYPLTGILLAGGKSSRMGQEKGLVEFKGKPLVQYGIDLLATYTERIIISSASPVYKSLGLEMVPDEIAGQGPAAGIAAALKHSRTPWNLVLACDLPFLEPELIDALLAATGDNQAVIPVHQGVTEPLAGLWHRDLAETLRLSVAAGNLALHRILQACNVRYLEIEPLLLKYPNLFANFNSLKEMDPYL